MGNLLSKFYDYLTAGCLSKTPFLHSLRQLYSSEDLSDKEIVEAICENPDIIACMLKGEIQSDAEDFLEEIHRKSSRKDGERKGHLEKELVVLGCKLHNLEMEKILETRAGEKFRLEKEIEELKEERHKIEAELDRLEKNERKQ